MLEIDTQVSSEIAFEIDEATPWSTILHKIVHNIQIDELKIHKVAMFERPLLARIYIKDLTFNRAKPTSFLQNLLSKPSHDDYDYIIHLNVQNRQALKGICSYNIQPSNLSTSADRLQNIKQLISHSILKALKAQDIKPSISKFSNNPVAV